MPSNTRFRSLVFRGLRLGFRLTPMPTATRDRLRQRFLAKHADLVPEGPKGLAVSSTSMRPYDHAAHRAFGHVARSRVALPASLPATVVAFYLPQFHPIPENDRWWGPGFTEWRNVARALPQFEGHVQPKLPADLGYYDLRLPGVMREQMAIAREYGVGAFCTYFYWFAGKTLLESPLRQWLEDPSLDLPICLCWANENWSRRWDGREDDLLISQDHGPDDDLAFIAYAAAYLRDPRYLRVEGKPMLLVYRPGLLPEPRETAGRWRRWCRDNGIGEIHLAYVQSFDNVDPATIGFDAAVSFPPNNTSLEPITATKRLINPAFGGQVLDWRDLARASVATSDPSYRLYPAANPGWDNEARRAGRGRSFVHATPRAFSAWLRSAIATARRRSPDAPLVFVNAWNEWAEGAVLEPDVKFGYAWLDAIRRALSAPTVAPSRPCLVTFLDDARRLEPLVRAIAQAGADFRLVLTTTAGAEARVRSELDRLAIDADLRVGDLTASELPLLVATASWLHDQGEAIVLCLPDAASAGDDPLSPPRVRAALAAFAANPDLGVLLSSEGAGGRPSRDEDPAALAYVCSLAGLAEPADHLPSPSAGDAFWCRLEALAPLADAPFCAADFAGATGATGAAMAAAWRRAIPAAALRQGFHTLAALPGPT